VADGTGVGEVFCVGDGVAVGSGVGAKAAQLVRAPMIKIAVNVLKSNFDIIWDFNDPSWSCDDFPEIIHDGIQIMAIECFQETLGNS
jgi:hypothetical protein